jgi:hypothetical protein
MAFWICGAMSVAGLLALSGAELSTSHASSHKRHRFSSARPICTTQAVRGSRPNGRSWGEVESDERCFSTCGGEIPWPFQVANQVAELAHGERYVLLGRVEFRAGMPTFVVDLREHAWLSNGRRRQDPAYPLLGSIAYWKKYDERIVQLRAEARWAGTGREGADAVEVYLQSQSDPAVLSTLKKYQSRPQSHELSGVPLGEDWVVDFFEE